MEFWVGITDFDWFTFLKARRPGEVNFWQPSGRVAFKALEPGGLFLFKLHSPQNFIVGGGYFLRHTKLPARLAWEAFEENNGVQDLSELLTRITKYRKTDEPNPEIGCNILIEPFFFEREDWIPVPPDWAPNIVKGKRYYTTERHGADLMARVSAQTELYAKFRQDGAVSEPDSSRYGAEYIARARMGQGAFRVLITDIYHRRCAITNEKTLPALEAAHIKPYSYNGPHLVSNGVLMRSDMHRLFDAGYLTITSELKVEVSGRIKEEFENGREYYAHHGKGLTNLPNESWAMPSREFIDWHNETVYRG